MDTIIQGIKEAHKGDSTSAPDTTVAQEIERVLEEVAKLKGSRTEQLILLFCKQTKLKYNRLTDEAKRLLTQIEQKSELLKTYIPQRGKRQSIVIFVWIW